MLFSSRVRVRIRFRVWLVSCYAHVIVRLSIVIVTVPFADRVSSNKIRDKILVALIVFVIVFYFSHSDVFRGGGSERCSLPRVGHGSIFADPIQSNPPTHGSNPIQSIKLPENPDPIQSNPK